MRKRAIPFKVKRAGFPIEEYSIQNRVNSHIEFAQKYTEFAACQFMGMDIERWENLGYSEELMADAIAFWQLHGEIEVNQQDAKNRKEKSMSKKRR